VHAWLLLLLLITLLLGPAAAAAADHAALLELYEDHWSSLLAGVPDVRAAAH
jgi:hypothetical protein